MTGTVSYLIRESSQEATNIIKGEGDRGRGQIWEGKGILGSVLKEGLGGKHRGRRAWTATSKNVIKIK